VDRCRTRGCGDAGDQFSPAGSRRASSASPGDAAILDVTARDDIVLDPFCGSGTTIIAAERTSRRGYGLDLDPVYVDTTITRWQRMTKQAAVHATGKTFEEMRQERVGADGAS
jgi:23S rRNA G2445 N2-methylase RlmL